MKEVLQIWGPIYAVVLVLLIIGFIAMWRERH
jgi:hypothetical protein